MRALVIDSNSTRGVRAMKTLSRAKFVRFLAVFVVTLMGTGLLLGAASLTAGAEEKQQSRASKIDKSSKLNRKFLRIEKDGLGNHLQSFPVVCDSCGGEDLGCCNDSCSRCWQRADDGNYDDDKYGNKRQRRKPRAPKPRVD